MNMIIKRRQLLLATLIVALGAAVFVNWYYTGKEPLVSDSETTSADYIQNLGEAKYVNGGVGAEDYFTEAKMERDKANDEALEELNETLKNTATGTAEAEEISKSINELNSQIKAEKNTENLISGKINTECMVVLNGESAQVVVEKGVLDESVALQIMDTVIANTEADPTKVSISEAQ